MTTTTAALDDGASGDATGQAATTIEIVRSLDEVASLWRAFESRAIMTPYGRYDWVAAYQGSLPDGGRGTRVAVLRGSRGEPMLLMPFQVERRLGLAVAHSIGGKHANYTLPLMAPELAAALTATDAHRLLASAGRAMGVDLIAWTNVPIAWDGSINPFAAGGRPAASDAWSLRLEADGEATLARSMSADARKKMRKKARDLAKVGAVGIRRARTPEDVECMLDAFLRQKRQRLGDRGIVDPFAEEAVQAFLRRAATERLAEDRPAMELHCLTVDGEIVAVIGGAADERRFSGMIVSFQAGRFERFSPGEMLVAGVVRDQCARGRAVFDLGVGDARYKRSICDETDALVDVTVPLTARGHAAAALQSGLRAAKRRIKASPRAMALVARARRLYGRPG